MKWNEFFFHEKPVIEIGSGHRPYPFSDVLVDKSLNNSERGGDLQTDGRPLVLADLQDLPFRSNSFGYSICSHVIEHVADPSNAIDELQRISKAGYIETPSALYELIEPQRQYHKWLILQRDDALHFFLKKKFTPKNDIVFRLLKNNIFFRIFAAASKSMFVNKYYWKLAISHEMHEEDLSLSSIDVERVRFWNGFVKIITIIFSKFLFRIQRLQIRSRKNFCLDGILICPSCKSEVIIESNSVDCIKCGKSYKRHGNIFIMNSDTTA